MTIKRSAKLLTLREQVIEDALSGLTLRLQVAEDGTSRLMIFGGIPFGNRESIFNHEGKEAGAGTSITQMCRASTAFHFGSRPSTDWVFGWKETATTEMPSEAESRVQLAATTYDSRRN